MVLGASRGPPFEPFQSVDLKPLLRKRNLSPVGIGIYQESGRSVREACLEFGLDNSKVILKPRYGYVPKVLSTALRAQVVTLLAHPPSTENGEG